MDDLILIISKYGFPTVASLGIAGMVYYVWKWVSVEILPVIDETYHTLVRLIDRIRTLDNDLIRLHQKVNVILTLRSKDPTSHTPNKKAD